MNKTWLELGKTFHTTDKNKIDTVIFLERKPRERERFSTLERNPKKVFNKDMFKKSRKLRKKVQIALFVQEIRASQQQEMLPGDDKA